MFPEPSLSGPASLVAVITSRVPKKNSPSNNSFFRARADASGFFGQPATDFVSTATNLEFLVPYYSSIGGYEFAILLGTRYEAYPITVTGYGYSDYSLTASIVDVTLADGSAVPGGVTFASGFQLDSGGGNQTVPESTSAAIFLIGAGSLALVHRRSRASTRR